MTSLPPEMLSVISHLTSSSTLIESLTRLSNLLSINPDSTFESLNNSLLGIFETALSEAHSHIVSVESSLTNSVREIVAIIDDGKAEISALSKALSKQAPVFPSQDLSLSEQGRIVTSQLNALKLEHSEAEHEMQTASLSLLRLSKILSTPSLSLPPPPPEALQDLSKFSRDAIKSQVRQAQLELEKREEGLARTVEAVWDLYIELGEFPKESQVILSDAQDGEVIPVDESLARAQFDSYVTALLAVTQDDEAEILSVLPRLPETARQPLPTHAVLTVATAILADLADLEQSRKARIQQLYDACDALWKNSDVKQEERDAFVMRNIGCMESVVDAYEEELARMQQLRKENLGLFINRIRQQIKESMRELLYLDGDIDIAQDGRDVEEYGCTEELLEMKEGELLAFKAEFADKQHVLSKIAAYKAVTLEAEELQATVMDQSRLTGKGAKRDVGRLLREEKMRKRVAKKPAMESDLEKSLLAWEKKSSKPFLVYGRRLVDCLKEERIKAQHERDNKKRIRMGLPPEPLAPIASSSNTLEIRKRPIAATPQQSTAKRTKMMTPRTPSAGFPQSHSRPTTSSIKQRSISTPMPGRMTATPLGSIKESGSHNNLHHLASPSIAAANRIHQAQGVAMQAFNEEEETSIQPSVPTPFAEKTARRKSFRPSSAIIQHVSGGAEFMSDDDAIADVTQIGDLQWDNNLGEELEMLDESIVQSV